MCSQFYSEWRAANTKTPYFLGLTRKLNSFVLAPFNVTAKVAGAGLVAVPMPGNSALITQFRKAKTMSAFAQGLLAGSST